MWIRRLCEMCREACQVTWGWSPLAVCHLCLWSRSNTKDWVIHLCSRHLSNLNLLRNEIKVDSCLIAPYPFVRRVRRFIWPFASSYAQKSRPETFVVSSLYFLTSPWLQFSSLQFGRDLLSFALKKKIFDGSVWKPNQKSHLTSWPLLCWSRLSFVFFL